MNEEKLEKPPQGERRTNPAMPDGAGMIDAPGYAGPDRRSHTERQRRIIHKEKMAFLNRTTISVGIFTAAVLYAIVFLLAPEMREMSDNAARMKEMEARMNILNQQVAAQAQEQARAKAEADQYSSIGGAISRKIGAVEDVVKSASDTVQQTAAAAIAVAAPAAGVEDLLQLLSGIQNLSRTPAGDAALAKAIVSLKSAVDIAGDDPANIAAAIAVARNQDPTLKALFSHIEDNRLTAATLLLTFDDLRRRIAKQEPFEGDLALAAAIAGSDPAVRALLQRLLPYAASGILGRDTLKGQLVSVAADIAAAQMEESGSPQSDVLNKLSGYVKVRRAPEENAAANAAVAAAQAAVEGGDVRAAVASMQTLEGPAATAAAPWMMAANGYIAAEESTDILSQTILQVLTAAAGGNFSLPGLIDIVKNNIPAEAQTGGAAAVVPYLSTSTRDQGTAPAGAKVAPYE